MAKHALDLELIEALRRGEAGAEERFLKAYYERIFSFGMMVCGHREDAEDITQESLVAALKSVKDLRSAGAFHVWLFRIVRNACYRQRSLQKHGEHEAVAMEELAETAPASGAAWPEQMLLQEETRRMVQAAIATLPAQDRLVVLLRDFEELSTAEVGKIMELKAAAVKMRLHRARRKLRAALLGHQAGSDAGGGSLPRQAMK
ncbi:MAG TPA: sigma-70 family RNA polymerase sigma factor [Terriglobales bacterium]|nr:sigma-70 family RNA polymerase sigma factor [Terriglobales bacterium]